MWRFAGGRSRSARQDPDRRPTTLDPAVQGDAGSAAITAQLFESLTAFDADLQLRPALAESWTFADGGRQVTFHLAGPDVLGRQSAPAVGRRAELAAAHRSEAAVAAGVARARHRRRRGVPPRHAADPASVGLQADDAADDLTVDLVRPATDFVNIVAGPDVRGRAAGRRRGPGRPRAGHGLRRRAADTS